MKRYLGLAEEEPMQALSFLRAKQSSKSWTNSEAGRQHRRKTFVPSLADFQPLSWLRFQPRAKISNIMLE